MPLNKIRYCEAMNMTHSTPQTNSTIPPSMAERFWRATVSRDARADGTFVLGVRSTSIYCRPSCPARRPLRRNVVFFHNGAEAEQQGFRPCLRCRPNEVAGSVSLVERASRELATTGDDDPLRFSVLADKLGTTTGTLRRAFLQVTGLLPRDLAAALRLDTFKKLLRNGRSITDALYETGYGSTSRVYERSDAQLGMTPATYKNGGKGMKIGYSIAKSSLGNILVGATDRGISAVYLGDNPERLVSELHDEYPNAVITAVSDSFGRWVKEIVKRVEGNPPMLELPLDLQATAFQRRVWQELQKIPRGSTRTYTQIARSLGNAKSVRAVARACVTNPVSIVVPCHRVIREDGNLAGYRWGLSRKQQLLQHERSTAHAK